MATQSENGNATSGPTNLVPVSNKLQDRMNALREVIDKNKSDVLRVIGEMKQLIEEGTQRIIRELEGVWDQVDAKMNDKRQEINRKIEEINRQKNVLQYLIKDLNPTLNPFGDLDKAMNSIKREMDIDIPYIKLTWRVNELTESIQRMCTCEQLYVKYREDSNIGFKWGTCSKGKGDDELWDPWGVAIDSIYNRKFVADFGANRLQIFSVNGDWIKSLNNEWFESPENIYSRKLFVYSMQ